MHTPALRFALPMTLALAGVAAGCIAPPPPAAVGPTPAPPTGPPAPKMGEAREATAPPAPRTPTVAPARQIAAVPYSWKNVQILGGGFVTGIVFHPTEPDLVYARTDIGGAYRYSKDDKAWIPLLDVLGRDELPYWGVESIALD